MFAVMHISNLGMFSVVDEPFACCMVVRAPIQYKDDILPV